MQRMIKTYRADTKETGSLKDHAEGCKFENLCL